MLPKTAPGIDQLEAMGFSAELERPFEHYVLGAGEEDKATDFVNQRLIVQWAKFQICGKKPVTTGAEKVRFRSRYSLEHKDFCLRCPYLKFRLSPLPRPQPVTFR